MANKIRKFIVTCVDSGGSADGRPRFIGLFDTHARAKQFVDEDIECYEDTGYEVNYEDMSATSDDADCVWNIEEVELDKEEL